MPADLPVLCMAKSHALRKPVGLTHAHHVAAQRGLALSSNGAIMTQTSKFGYTQDVCWQGQLLAC